MLTRLNAVNSILSAASLGRVSSLTSVGSFGSRTYTSTDDNVEAQEVLDQVTAEVLADGRRCTMKRNVEKTVSGGAVALAGTVIKVRGVGYSDRLDLGVLKEGVGFVDRKLTENGAATGLAGSPGFANKYLIDEYHEADFDTLEEAVQIEIVKKAAQAFIERKLADPNRAIMAKQHADRAESRNNPSFPPGAYALDERLKGLAPQQ